MTTPTPYTVDGNLRVDFTQPDPNPANSALTNLSVSIPTNAFADGTETDTNLGTAMYAKAAGTINIGDLVYLSLISGVWTATQATTAAVGAIGYNIGIAQYAMTVGQYGWFFLGEFKDFQVNCAVSLTINTQLTTTTTAGVAGTGGTAVTGLWLNVATTTAGLYSARATSRLKVAA